MAEASTISFFSTLLPRFQPHSQVSHRPLSLPRKPQVRCSVSAGSTPQNAVAWGCEIESLESASALQSWLSESGLPPQKMGIDRVEVGERGLVALKNIRKGEKLLFVPPSLVITPNSVTSLFHSFNFFEFKFVGTYIVVFGFHHHHCIFNCLTFFISICWYIR